MPVTKLKEFSDAILDVCKSYYADVDALSAERDRLAAENAELRKEVERLQKSNDDLIAQGPRLFDMGTVLAADPVMLNLAHQRYVSEAAASVALAAEADKDGTGSRLEPMGSPRDKTDDWESRMDGAKQTGVEP